MLLVVPRMPLSKRSTYPHHEVQIIASTTTAGGGAGIAASNWNNVGGLSGSASDLVDASGSATGAGIVWEAAGVWGDDSANTDASVPVGNAQIMRGYLDDGQTDDDVGVSITLTTIPYAEYFIAIYYSTDFAPADPGFKVTTLNDGNTTTTIQTAAPRESWGDNPTLGAHNTAASGSLTGSTLTVTVPHRFADGNGDRRGTVAGIQIIQIPEPSVVSLSGLAALGLAFRRRRG